MTTTTGLACSLRFFLRIIVLLIGICLISPAVSSASRTVTVGIFENEPKVFTSSTGKPSGIFIDIIEHIAKMDGYAVAAELKKQSELEKVPIIAVTSSAMVGDREQILAAGATGYIEKPINPETFVDEIIKYFPEEWQDREGREEQGGEHAHTERRG